MANTRYVFDALSARFPSSNAARIVPINSTERLAVIAFAPTTSQTVYFVAKVPQGITGNHQLVATYCMASATTGGIAVDVAVEAITSGDAVDLDATTSFDTANTGTDASVPATAGYMETVTVSLTNVDSWAAGDLVLFRVSRNVGHGTDTAAGDLYLINAEWQDAA